MKQWTEVMKNITILTQFGLSLLTPTLLCLGISWWLMTKFSLGGWIFIPGFFFGLGGSATVAYKLYLSVNKKNEKEKEEKKQYISYNRHS